MDAEDIPTDDELAWDQERVNELDMWYYITGSTLPKEQCRIQCDLWDTYRWSRIWWSETNDGNGIPAPSGMGYIYMTNFCGRFLTTCDEDMPSQDELACDQEEPWDSWWWREKSDDVLEDIRYTYRCHSIWHTYTEPKDIFAIPSPVDGYWYLKHRNGDVFHSEDEGIIEYLAVFSEHDVYAEIEKEEKEDIPDVDEVMLDEARSENPLFERALELGWKIQNYWEWEEIEEQAYRWEQSPERNKQDEEDYKDHFIYLEE